LTHRNNLFEGIYAKRSITLPKLYIQFFTLFILIYSQFFGQGYPVPKMTDHAKTSIPSYAKWGKLAMKETKQKYPDAEIIDYLHKGRQKKGDAMIEQFKLWLRGESREFGVFVNIEFDSKTEKVLHITFLETDR